MLIIFLKLSSKLWASNGLLILNTHIASFIAKLRSDCQGFGQHGIGVVFRVRDTSQRGVECQVLTLTRSGFVSRMESFEKAAFIFNVSE